MTREEYKICTEKFRIQDVPYETDLKAMVQLQAATLRAFVQEPGYEELWEEETQARVARQQVLSKLPSHAR